MNSASARHRIEASKELRMVADNGPEAAPVASASEKFLIQIDLGGCEVLRYPLSDDKTNKPDELLDANPRAIKHDTDNTDTTSTALLPMIAANKRKDDGSGEPV